MTHTKKLLVTGASGFVGSYVRNAVEAGDFGNYQMQAFPDGLDIRDSDAVLNAVAKLDPDAVLHLAAQSQVPEAFRHPEETFQINLMGTMNLLQGLSRLDGFDRLVYVSSGDVYGAVDDSDLPVHESHFPVPRNPYAVSKLSAEHLCRQWHLTEGLDVVIVRPFNHIGPGQDARFVVPALAEQVLQLASGTIQSIAVGDIDVSRDFTDVRDVVCGYASVFRDGREGATYNICSGKATVVRDILESLCRLAGVEPRIHQDPDRMRPSEQRHMVASYDALHRDTGWVPSIPLETSLGDILQSIRNRQGI